MKKQRPKEYRYYFQIELCGIGHNEGKAWADAVEAFMLDPGVADEVKKGEEVK